MYEKDLSTQQCEKETNSRFSGAFQNQKRKGGLEKKKGQGQEEIERLNFPKKRHLRKRAEFLACYNWGSRYFTSNLIVFALKREPDGQGWRLGIAASKKIGPAVHRNRFKRLAREYFRQHQKELNADLDIVVVAKRKINVTEMDYWQLEAELEPLLRKIMRKQGMAKLSQPAG